MTDKPRVPQDTHCIWRLFVDEALPVDIPRRSGEWYVPSDPDCLRTNARQAFFVLPLSDTITSG